MYFTMCVHGQVFFILGGLAVWEYILSTSPNRNRNPEYKFPLHILFHIWLNLSNLLLPIQNKL